MDDLTQDFRELLGRPPRLLLAHDAPQELERLQSLFAHDCEVFGAGSGAEALDLARAQWPDLALLHACLPDLGGEALCRLLKSDPALATMPVLLLCEQPLDEAGERGALDAGAADLLSPPWQAVLLRRRVRNHLTHKLQGELLHELAFVDGLTGLHNRRYFDERLECELNRGRRNGTPLGLLLADVDCFKLYNHYQGHQAGDNALLGLAVALHSSLKRPGDLVCRAGGARFAVLLPETEMAGAERVAQRFEEAVRSLRIPHEHSSVPGGGLSLSVGGVVCVPGARHHGAGLMAAAEAQLQEAKRRGRARSQLQAA
jgi:diguanylate cyclase (GGDEF)-like protein